MTAGSYDPFALDKPVIKLGALGEWTLADTFAAVSAKDDASMSDVAAAVGELAEAACVDSDGLAKIIVGLCDEKVHGDAALGSRALGGLVQFVVEWLQGEATAGNG